MGEVTVARHTISRMLLTVCELNQPRPLSLGWELSLTIMFLYGNMLFPAKTPSLERVLTAPPVGAPECMHDRAHIRRIAISARPGYGGPNRL